MGCAQFSTISGGMHLDQLLASRLVQMLNQSAHHIAMLGYITHNLSGLRVRISMFHEDARE